MVAAETAKGVGALLLTIENDLAGWIEHGGPELAVPIPSDRPWYLLFTSGTTGLPKSVIQTAGMAWANTINIGQAIDIASTDRSACFLPLFHTAGINLYTLPIFLSGGSSTIFPKFEVGEIRNLIASGQINQFFAVPAVYQALSLAPWIDDLDWRNIRCGCGGAPLSEPLTQFFAERGVKVLNGMGMTETGPTVFLMDPARAEQKIGSVGKPTKPGASAIARSTRWHGGCWRVAHKRPRCDAGLFWQPGSHGKYLYRR